MSNCFKNPVIFINGAPHKPRVQHLSGFELKHLARLSPDLQLFLRSPTRLKDRPVGDMESLEMKDGLDLYGLSTEQLPEGWNTWDGRAIEVEPDGGNEPGVASAGTP